MKDGDGTCQFKQLNVIDAESGNKIELIKQILSKTIKTVEKLSNLLNENEKSLKSSREKVPELLDE